MWNINRLQRLNIILFSFKTKNVPALTNLANNILIENFAPKSAILQSLRQVHLNTTLHKYIKKSKREEDSDDEAEESLDFKDERDSKVVKTKVNSLRADVLVKAGLGLARNKVEIIFYGSKIRVNGEKLQKKSTQLNIGDEIDVIKGFSQNNPSHLMISRVIILDAKPREDEGLNVNLRRYKSLLIENYNGINAYKSSETATDH